jgi:hypothetical protein
MVGLGSAEVDASGLGTANVSAGAIAPLVTQGQVSTQNSRLAVPAPEHATFDHRGDPQPGSQHEQNQSIATSPGTGPPFANQRHASVVVDGQGEVERPARPAAQVDSRTIRELVEVIEDPGTRRVDEARIRKPDTAAIPRGDPMFRAQPSQRVGDGFQPC